MFVIDASVWVSMLVEEDTFHDISLQWVTSQVRSFSEIAEPTIAIPEIAGAVARRKGGATRGIQASSLLGNVPNLHFVAIDMDLARTSARIAAAVGLRGADAVYVALAQSLGFKLITWDNEMLEKASGVCFAAKPEFE